MVKQPENFNEQSPPTSRVGDAANELNTECLRSEEFIDKLKPSDITISSAMAMSAAAISPYLGKNRLIERHLTHFLTVFGVDMAADVVYNINDERDKNTVNRHKVG